jgi:hypothetical protein
MPQHELRRLSFRLKLELAAASQYRRDSVQREWRLRSAAARHGAGTHSDKFILKSHQKGPLERS